MAANVLTITETAASAQIAATVKNVDVINHQNLAGVAGAVNYNELLYSGVNKEIVTKAVAGSITNLTNASAATVFGDSAGINDTLTVSFANSGVTSGQTFNVVLDGSGAATAASTVDYVGANSDINAIALATTGTNNVILNGTTGVKTITITGAGNSTIALNGAGAFSTTSAVTIDASKATGNLTIDLGANTSAGGVSVLGSTGTATTTLGVLVAGAQTLPTITNVETLQLDAGSAGTLISTNSSITSVTLATNFGLVGTVNTLQGFTGINNINYQTLGGQANTFGALVTPTAGATTVNFTKLGTNTIGGANTLTVGALTLNGATTLGVNTANGVGGTTAATFNGVTSNTLSSLSFTGASTGLLTTGVISTRNAAGTGGSLVTLDLSKVTGTSNTQIGATVAVGAANAPSQVLAANAVITGSALGSTINFGANQAVGFTVNLVGGNNTVNAAASLDLNGGAGAIQSGNINVVSSDVAGNLNAINTGAGTDFITLGLGTNNVNTGGGTDVVTINASSTALNTFTVNVAAGSTTYTGLNADTVNIGAATTQNLGTGHTASTVNMTANVAASLNNLNGDTVNFTVSGATVAEGAHTVGTVFNASAAVAAAYTATVTGNIAADSFNMNLTNVGANNMALTTTGVGGSTYTLTAAAGGAGQFVLNLNNTGGTDTVTYTAGAVDTNTITLGATSTSNLTILGSANQAQAVVVQGNNGQTITLTAAHTAANTVTSAFNGANTGVFNTITNVVGDGATTAAADDVIAFAAIAGNNGIAGAGWVQNQVFATEAAGIAAVLAIGGVPQANSVYQFVVGGNTFLYEKSVTGATVSATDTVVQLTGIHTIANGAAGAGAVIINT